MHLHKEIKKLKNRVLELGAEVEDNVQRAITSVKTRNVHIAEEISGGDQHIDRLEVDLEEECLKVMALHQPVAIDLRFIVAILKMNADLERIGDQALNLAWRSTYLASHDPISIPDDLYLMANKAVIMLHQSLDALINLDCELAFKVCEADDQVDEFYRKIRGDIQKRINVAPKEIMRLIQLLEMAHQIERIGDLATNVAEDVVYMITGEIIRHGRTGNATDRRKNKPVQALEE